VCAPVWYAKHRWFYLLTTTAMLLLIGSAWRKLEDATCGLHGTVHVTNAAAASRTATCRGSAAMRAVAAITVATSSCRGSVTDWSSKLCQSVSELSLSLSGACVSSSHAANSSAVQRRGTFPPHDAMLACKSMTASMSMSVKNF